MEAKVNSVYFTVGGEPTELPTEKSEVQTYDSYLFKLHRKIHFDVEMGYEPQDGLFHSLMFVVTVDGKEVDTVTDVLPRILDNRVGHYYADIPSYAKYSKPGKYHTVQISIKHKAYVRNHSESGELVEDGKYEDIYDSEVYYYKVGVPYD